MQLKAIFTAALLLLLIGAADANDVAEQNTVTPVSGLKSPLYSAAGTALPACGAGAFVTELWVSDQAASSCVNNAPYASGGTATCPVICANGVGWTVVGGNSAGSLPANVPAPPTIIPLRAPTVSPVIVGPGTTVGSRTVVGNCVQNGTTGAWTGTDDTAAIKGLFTDGHDVTFTPGQYCITGTVDIATNRIMACQSGAIFAQTVDTGQFPMIGIGRGTAQAGNNDIGPNCTFVGSDLPSGIGSCVAGTPASCNYANARGGTSGYNWLMKIVSGGNATVDGPHVSNVNVQNNIFRDGQGDFLLVDSRCGLQAAFNQTTGWCNHGLPGTEGPDNITIAHNQFFHGVQPHIHINGGQHIVVAYNQSEDGQIQTEQDANTLQVISGIYYYKNDMTTNCGVLDPIDNSIRGAYYTGNGKAITGADGRGVWVVQGSVAGSCAATCTAGHTNTQLDTASNATFGNLPAHYYGVTIGTGATQIGQDGNQINVPWCGGTTGLFNVCTSTHYTDNPLSAY